jgi:hypothetical protein
LKLSLSPLFDDDDDASAPVFGCGLFSGSVPALDETETADIASKTASPLLTASADAAKKSASPLRTASADAAKKSASPLLTASTDAAKKSASPSPSAQVPFAESRQLFSKAPVTSINLFEMKANPLWKRRLLTKDLEDQSDHISKS